MASIRKRGNGWSVQVRRKGFSPLYRTFGTKAAAQAWAREQEAKADRNDNLPDLRQLRSLTVADLIDRYAKEITPKKRSANSELPRLQKFREHSLARLPVTDLEPKHIAAYRDERLARAAPATVKRELAILQHVFAVAERDWNLGSGRNPVAAIRHPKIKNARDRRLRKGEWTRLVSALRACRNPLVLPIVEFAVETGMRRSEILSLLWANVDLQQRTAHLPTSKNGNPRTVPLTEGALAVFHRLRKISKGAQVFPISANAFRLAWERAKRRAGLIDLRFHDLRHEAISRFCELGLSIPEVAVISGHRDARMLFRYTHLRPSDLALKLARLTSSDTPELKEAA